MATQPDEYPGGWFGESWGAPVCDEMRHLPVPLDQTCPECNKGIRLNDNGMIFPGPEGLLAYHRLCFLRTVIPCEMWSEEMKRNMPQRWADHMAEFHA
jgi:hypothetical protein